MGSCFLARQCKKAEEAARNTAEEEQREKAHKKEEEEDEAILKVGDTLRALCQHSSLGRGRRTFQRGDVGTVVDIKEKGTEIKIFFGANKYYTSSCFSKTSA